jgi:3-carboxy-cis,cis-muconate cycloisomerase
VSFRLPRPRRSPYAPGRGESNTMPQKRNPIASEYILASARGVHALVPLMLQAMAGDHERSSGPWQSEELALAQMFVSASATFAPSRAALPSTPSGCAAI